MFELIASVLAAAPIQARTLGPEKRTRNTGNTAMFVIDIATFRPVADFADDADAAGGHSQGVAATSWFDEITLPGERWPEPKLCAANPAFRFRRSFGRSLKPSPRRTRSDCRN